jgi:hypothetical protein
MVKGLDPSIDWLSIYYCQRLKSLNEHSESRFIHVRFLVPLMINARIHGSFDRSHAWIPRRDSLCAIDPDSYSINLSRASY